MRLFKRGDQVIVEGKKIPGVVINARGSKVSVRTDDNRSLVNISSDKVNLLKLAEKLFT